MKPLTRNLLTAATLMFAVSLCTPPAHAEEHKVTVRAGYLTCHVASGWGFIFGSSRKIIANTPGTRIIPRTTRAPSPSSAPTSAIFKSAVILWAVVAPTTDLGEGALAGHYGGATASVSLGVGAGANVLVGGFKKSIALAADLDRRPKRS